MPSASTHDSSRLLVVTEEVIHEVTPWGSRRPQRFIRFHEGQMVSGAEVAQAEADGLTVKTRPVGNDEYGAHHAVLGRGDLVNTPALHGEEVPEGTGNVEIVDGANVRTKAGTGDAEPQSGDEPDAPGLQFNADDFTVEQMTAWARENEVDLDGATKRDDVIAAITSDPRVVDTTPAKEA